MMSKTTGEKNKKQLDDLIEIRYRQSFGQEIKDQSHKLGPKVPSGPFMRLNKRSLMWIKIMYFLILPYLKWSSFRSSRNKNWGKR